MVNPRPGFPISEDGSMHCRGLKDSTRRRLAYCFHLENKYIFICHFQTQKNEAIKSIVISYGDMSCVLLLGVQ